MYCYYNSKCKKNKPEKLKSESLHAGDQKRKAKFLEGGGLHEVKKGGGKLVEM